MRGSGTLYPLMSSFPQSVLRGSRLFSDSLGELQVALGIRCNLAGARGGVIELQVFQKAGLRTWPGKSARNPKP